MQYLKKDSSNYVDFLRVVRCLGKLQSDHVILAGSGQACWDIPEIKNSHQ